MVCSFIAEYLKRILNNVQGELSGGWRWGTRVKNLFSAALTARSGGACLQILRGPGGCEESTKDVAATLRYVLALHLLLFMMPLRVLALIGVR